MRLEAVLAEAEYSCAPAAWAAPHLLPYGGFLVSLVSSLDGWCAEREARTGNL